MKKREVLLSVVLIAVVAVWHSSYSINYAESIGQQKGPQREPGPEVLSGPEGPPGPQGPTGPDGLMGMSVVMGHVDEYCGGYGSGFTSVQRGIGDCIITFSPAFTGAPVATATASVDSFVAGIVSLTTTTMRVRLFVGANRGEASFYFIAIAPAQPPPNLALSFTGCTSCKAGDTFSVTARVQNPASTPIRMEVKAGVVFPDGSELNLWVVPDRHFEVTLAAGLDTMVELLRVTVPPGLPTGVWAYEGVLLSPELGRILARDTKSFTVQ